MLRGLFGRAKNTTSVNSALKYLVSTSDSETWEQRISTSLRSLHENLVKNSLSTSTNVGQSAQVVIGSVRQVTGLSININQTAKTLNVAACNNEIIRQSISKEFASLLHQVDSAFRRENVNSLRSAIANEKNNSIVSSFLSALGAGGDSETTLGSRIDNEEQLKTEYASRLARIRNELHQSHSVSTSSRPDGIRQARNCTVTRKAIVTAICCNCSLACKTLNRL